MGFSGGSSSNQSTQNSYGYNQNLAQSMSAQNVWGPQAAALGGLYGQASSLANSQAGQVGPAAQRLSAAGMNATNAGISNLQNLAGGGGALAAYASPNSALAQQQLADATSNIQQQMSRVTMPGINSQAGAYGGVGGGRQGIAQGVAMGDAAQAVAQAGTGIYANIYNTGASAAEALGNQRLQAAGALPGAAQAGYNLGMSPFSSAWGPFSQLASILGGPTVLGSSLSQALGQGENWGTAQSSGKGSQFGLKLWG